MKELIKRMSHSNDNVFPGTGVDNEVISNNNQIRSDTYGTNETFEDIKVQENLPSKEKLVSFIKYLQDEFMLQN